MTVCNVRQNNGVENMSHFSDSICIFSEPVNLDC